MGLSPHEPVLALTNHYIVFQVFFNNLTTHSFSSLQHRGEISWNLIQCLHFHHTDLKMVSGDLSEATQEIQNKTQTSCNTVHVFNNGPKHQVSLPHEIHFLKKSLY